MRQRKDQNSSLAKGSEHSTQLRPVQIRRISSDIRDELGLFNDIENVHRTP